MNCFQTYFSLNYFVGVTPARSKSDLIVTIGQLVIKKASWLFKESSKSTWTCIYKTVVLHIEILNNGRKLFTIPVIHYGRIIRIILTLSPMAQLMKKWCRLGCISASC
jgi:hypothetical protein